MSVQCRYLLYLGRDWGHSGTCNYYAVAGTDSNAESKVWAPKEVNCPGAINAEAGVDNSVCVEARDEQVPAVVPGSQNFPALKGNPKPDASRCRHFCDAACSKAGVKRPVDVVSSDDEEGVCAGFSMSDCQDLAVTRLDQNVGEASVWQRSEAVWNVEVVSNRRRGLHAGSDKFCDKLHNNQYYAFVLHSYFSRSCFHSLCSLIFKSFVLRWLRITALLHAQVLLTVFESLIVP